LLLHGCWVGELECGPRTSYHEILRGKKNSRLRWS